MNPIEVGSDFVISGASVKWLDGSETNFSNPGAFGLALVDAYENKRANEQQPEGLYRIGYQSILMNVEFPNAVKALTLHYTLGEIKRNPQPFGDVEIQGEEISLFYPSAWDDLPKNRISWPGDHGAKLGRFFDSISDAPSLLMVHTRRSGHHPAHERDHYIGLTLTTCPDVIARGTICKLITSNPGDTYRRLGELDGLYTGRDDQRRY